MKTQLGMIKVEDFLRLRRQQMAYAQEHKGPHDIVVDVGEEMICDFCNDDIITEQNPVWVYLCGDSHALCKKCAEQTYLDELEENKRNKEHA